MATFSSGRRTPFPFPTEPEQFTIKSLCHPDRSGTDDSAAQPRRELDSLCRLTAEAFSARCRHQDRLANGRGLGSRKQRNRLPAYEGILAVVILVAV